MVSCIIIILTSDKNLPHHFERVLKNGAQQSLPDELKWFILAN